MSYLPDINSAPKRAMDLLRLGAAYMGASGMEQPAKEAEAVLCEVLDMETANLFIYDAELSDVQVTAVLDAFRRRAEHEPLQYIIGRVEFWNLKFKVGVGVLVPRPETELLVREALEVLMPHGKLKALDLCTGSGCIAVTLAHSRPQLVMHAVDSSEDALAYARQNAQTHSTDNVTFHQGDLFSPLEGMLFDVILSNPPYIISNEIDTLDAEVSKYEPRGALDGGADGLDFYRRIISQAPEYLKSGGWLIMELGAGQDAEVSALCKDAGLKVTKLVRDFAGHGRILVAQKT